MNGNFFFATMQIMPVFQLWRFWYTPVNILRFLNWGSGLNWTRAVATGFILIAIPSIALANAGIPMLAFTLPLMVIGLVPVIVVEAIFIARGLALSLRAAALLSGVANLVSMLIGVPLTWLALMALQGVTGGGSPLSNESHSTFLYILEAIWNAPWMGGFGPGWQITLAMLVLLVPYFLAHGLLSSKLLRG